MSRKESLQYSPSVAVVDEMAIRTGNYLLIFSFTFLPSKLIFSQHENKHKILICLLPDWLVEQKKQIIPSNNFPPILTSHCCADAAVAI